jgi:hypothetical protein
MGLIVGLFLPFSSLTTFVVYYLAFCFIDVLVVCCVDGLESPVPCCVDTLDSQHCGRCVDTLDSLVCGRCVDMLDLGSSFSLISVSERSLKRSSRLSCCLEGPRPVTKLCSFCLIFSISSLKDMNKSVGA